MRSGGGNSIVDKGLPEGIIIRSSVVFNVTCWDDEFIDSEEEEESGIVIAATGPPLGQPATFVTVVVDSNSFIPV